MSWKKYYRLEHAANAPKMPVQQSHGESNFTTGRQNNFLPAVLAGHPQRLQRYQQFDTMSMDSDVAAALDLISDFCTQSEEQNDSPFLIKYYDEQANDTEVILIKTALTKWVKLNDFKSRLWDIIKGTIKNGDQFFLVDPETGQFVWLDHYNVEMVKVDDDNGKTPEEYIIRGLDYNKQAKYATKQADMNNYRNAIGGIPITGGRPMNGSGGNGLPGGATDPRNRNNGVVNDQLYVVDATNIAHLSLSVGNDINWPFGSSVLEPVYGVYVQKKLIEDAVLIYRVSRAPERRVFKIDVGDMNPIRAKAHLEQIKNEVHQKRIPNRNGNGSNVMDAGYNALSTLDDYFFSQSSTGRGSSVDILPGGEQTGEIGDLLYFAKKIARGLRIPASYLALGGDEDRTGASHNDGKLSAAIIQEYTFNKYCMRIQALLAPVFDKHFKTYLSRCGLQNLDELFELSFNPPQNFSKYRQIELDAAQAQVFQGLAEVKYLSKRFLLKRFLNLTEDELLENERLYSEENPKKMKKELGASSAETTNMDDLGSVGVRDFGGGDDFDPEALSDNESLDGSIPPDGTDAPPGPSGAPQAGGNAPAAASAAASGAPNSPPA